MRLNFAILRTWFASGLFLLAPTYSNLALVVNAPLPAAVPLVHHVGQWNGSTAVAIGPYHALTAKHVTGLSLPGCSENSMALSRPKTLSLGTQEYCIHRRFDHPQADLSILEIDPEVHPEGLDGYYRISSPRFLIKPGDFIERAGYGFQAGATANNGIHWSNFRGLSWGTNRVDTATSHYVVTSFSSSLSATPFEATAATHDSGSPLFLKDPCGNGVVIGIAVSTSSSTGFSRFGDRDYSIRIATYYDWIAEIVGPALKRERLILGDINQDQSVDTSDFQILAANFGKTGMRAQGDLNEDDVVNASDFQILASQFGKKSCEPLSSIY